MYYIRLHVDGVNKYLYNFRSTVFLQESARSFESRDAAQRYLRGKEIGKKYWHWIVEKPDVRQILFSDDIFYEYLKLQQ